MSLIEKTDYIIVQPQEAGYFEILNTFGNLLKTAGSENKDIIWDFRNAPLKMDYAELNKLKDVIKDKYPKRTKPNRKLAIVVEGGLNSALAKEYIRLADGIGPEYKIFSDLESAEEWITQN
jgi:hypothetical protein